MEESTSEFGSWTSKVFQRVLSYHETSEWSYSAEHSWLVNHKPWDCKMFYWIRSDCKQILLSLESTRRRGISFFMYLTFKQHLFCQRKNPQNTWLLAFSRAYEHIHRHRLTLVVMSYAHYHIVEGCYVNTAGKKTFYWICFFGLVPPIFWCVQGFKWRQLQMIYFLFICHCKFDSIGTLFPPDANRPLKQQ